MEALVALGAAFMVFVGIIGVFMVVTMWILFNKARQPGWAILIPIYNILVILKIAGKAWWWLFLLMIPIVNIVFMIMVYHGISKNFGKDAGFTIGLILLGIVFFPILAFGTAKYQPLIVETPQS